jgi:uncharacterized damage-inducible protein DinB
MKTSDLKAGDYHSYYKPYIETLGDEELLSLLRKQWENFPRFIQAIPDEKLKFAYEEGKWTVLEVLVHLLDAERVFQYRAMRFARMDQTPLPGFDQDAYVPHSMANSRTKEDIIREYRAVRESTILLFDNLPDKVLKQAGTASNVKMSVGALGFICCGHQRHHRNILRERYFV